MEKLTKLYGFKTALIFFVIGTILLLGYLITKNDTLILIGWFYVIIAVITNVIIEIILLFILIKNKENRVKTTLNIILIALNLPIAFIYFLIVINTI